MPFPKYVYTIIIVIITAVTFMYYYNSYLHNKQAYHTLCNNNNKHQSHHESLQFGNGKSTHFIEIGNWRYRNRKTLKPSKNIKNVLNSAFNDPGTALTLCNINEGPELLIKNNAHFDWWLFPWDLNSNKNEFRIDYDDMWWILKNIEVRFGNEQPWIKYSNAFTIYTQKVTPELILNSVSARYMKIIYSNILFIRTAKRNKAVDDIKNLLLGAKHLVDMHTSDKTQQLQKRDDPRSDGYKINNKGQREQEQRNITSGINELCYYIDPMTHVFDLFN